MLKSFFYNWERRLAAVDNDRVVRPFDWGLDWIPDSRATDCRPPHEVIGSFAREALANSERFFDPGPLPECRWLDEPRQADNPTRTLVFPSAYTTPHPANNTVYLRFFPGRHRRTTPIRNRRAVLVLPQWNADHSGHVGLCQLLAWYGCDAFRLSMPYHDRRRPAELERADYIVSANVGRTLQVCRQAVLDARRAIGWLSAEGYERIGILGTSLGSCLSMLTTAHEPLIRAQALNHISQYFADPIWEGLSTSHVRAGFDGHIDLDLLRDLWMPISPQAYVERVRGRRTVMIYGLYDLTFPLPLSLNLVNEFRRRNIEHERRILPCGHYTTGVTPFKYLDGYYLVRFMLRNL